MEVTKALVYLADLRYNYSGVLANDCMPLGVAYMKAVMARDMPNDVQSRLFAYPDRLLDAISSHPPDVLMLSNYVWNEALSRHVAKLAKRVKPDMLVVMGGPNLSLETERQLAWFGQHRELDVYVLGEGDFLGPEVVRQYLDAGMSHTRFRKREIPSSISRRPDCTPTVSSTWERHKEIDEIPSPWLSGILDEFFDGALAPLLETNRGCPFTCTFCVQGTRWYTKVHNFTVDRVKEEIGYIARRIHSVCPQMGTLRIADSNYGMFERDIEISEFIGRMTKEYGYPKYIDATTGKNRPDRIINSVEKAGGTLVVYQAVQSLDENVLRNVKRQTIKLEAYEQLHVYMRGRGMRSNSDLILGLPGETLQTHEAAQRRLLDSGINQVTNFQLMMLKGSELETMETRNTFGFSSAWRVLPKNFGIYGGDKVLDAEEIIVSTDTLSFEDYITCRKFALCSVAFWRNDAFESVVVFLDRFGVRRSDCWDIMLPALEASEGPTRQYLDDFVRETRNELFPTREACIEFYRTEENWQRLVRGEIGDNLMHKYHALATFHFWPHICEIAMTALRLLATRRGVAEQVPDFERFWRNLAHCIELRYTNGYSKEEILATRRGWLEYDIPCWLRDGAPNDIQRYLLDGPTEVAFYPTREGVDGLSSAFQVYTTSVRGLTKMVSRINKNWLTCDHSYTGRGKEVGAAVA